MPFKTGQPRTLLQKPIFSGSNPSEPMGLGKDDLFLDKGPAPLKTGQPRSLLQKPSSFGSILSKPTSQIKLREPAIIVD